MKEWFVKGRVSLNGMIIQKPHHRLADPRGCLKVGQPPAAVLLAQMPIRIHAQLNLLYIDESLAIVNKGAGLLSVPIENSSQPSALSLLDKYISAGQKPSGRGLSQKSLLTTLPVHRLDQFTSGVLCFAMNPTARESLVKQVRNHSFIREYQALVDGIPHKRRGTWRSWFQLDEAGMEQTVFDEPTAGATEAVSHFEIIDTIAWPGVKRQDVQTVCKLRLRLQSGLRHQLRIHASRAGVPILGDRHYHPDYKKALEGKGGMPHNCKRQALHASSLGFVHPVTGKTRRFHCKFPRDLLTVETALKAKGRQK